MFHDWRSTVAKSESWRRYNDEVLEPYLVDPIEVIKKKGSIVGSVDCIPDNFSVYTKGNILSPEESLDLIERNMTLLGEEVWDWYHYGINWRRFKNNEPYFLKAIRERVREANK